MLKWLSFLVWMSLRSSEAQISFSFTYIQRFAVKYLDFYVSFAWLQYTKIEYTHIHIAQMRFEMDWREFILLSSDDLEYSAQFVWATVFIKLIWTCHFWSLSAPGHHSLSLNGKEYREHPAEHVLCFSFGFGASWRWVKNDRISVLERTVC